MNHIYLDFQATTPPDPRVLAAMAPWWAVPANPHAQSHAMGRRAASAVEEARASVAALIGAEPAEVSFTAGATEAANIAIRSAGARARLAATAVEHACVCETVDDMVAAGATATTVAVDGDGIVDLDALGDALDGGVDLACVMAVNNETGAVQPVAEAGAMCRAGDALLFSDLSQAAGRVRVDVRAWGVDLACLSSHKVYGPMGIGALYARRGVRVDPIARGGGQERGLRPGTVPTPLAVGFGEACRLAAREAAKDAAHAGRLRRILLGRLADRLPAARVNGDPDRTVPHAISLTVPGVEAEALMAALPRLCMSTGSACSSGAIGHSHVLSAMGLPPDAMDGTIRIGLGRTTTEEEAAIAADMIAEAAERLRAPTRRLAGARA